ncbi:unnamed protein product [Boreogadus saida]
MDGVVTPPPSQARVAKGSENKLAKALYDNASECPDELAFRRGDILRVVDRSAVGTSGWWLCSLHGRQGVAPANRLQLLPPPAAAPAGTGAPEWPGPPQAEDHARPQNIYQVPSVPRPSGSPLYERMDKIYKVPSAAPSAPRGPGSPALRHGWESTEASRLTALGLSSTSPDGGGGVYDVPSRRPSLNPTQTSQRKTTGRKASLTSAAAAAVAAAASPRCSSPNDTYVYAVPPAQCREPCYDVPVPSAAAAAAAALQRTPPSSYSTLPSRRKGDWIYDVPVSPEKPGLGAAAAAGGTLPSRAPGRQLFPPPLGPPGPPGLYAGPERPLTGADLPALPPRVRASVYSQPPARRSSEEQVYAVPPPDRVGHIPLECRGDAPYPYDHARARLQRMRTVLGPASLRQRPGSDDPLLLLLEDEGGRADSRRAATDSQRISTASSSSSSSTSSSSSSSSTSSCDSTALSSSSCSPDPLREVGLSQEEAGARLLELHEAVGRAVHRLMDFVSSSWRSRAHLEKHLEEIRAAAEGIDRAVSGFLAFALDVKGNARHLTDANLRTRLLKQLSIVEDSGLILRQTVGSLSASGWPLDALSQDPGLLNTPDQLERFVMVARTVPEDVKRLVSILNANGRLLFRPNQREPGDGGPGDGGPGDGGPAAAAAAAAGGRQNGDAADDDNDYVQLQTKNEFERQKHRRAVDAQDGTPPPDTGHEETTPPVAAPPSQEVAPPAAGPRPEHCRLYFGALQKALGGFVGSLRGGQPPEQFIPHSKLVIMVGQRLVNTLYQDARGTDARQSLLCKSGHLCALLKQLAVATKKAALHFPDKQALREAHDFAGELAQKAQHFRISLDL